MGELFDIAVGTRATTKKWHNEQWSWAKLVKKLTSEHRTQESFKIYTRCTREERGRIKDVGGYVGGYLVNGTRGVGSVLHRQLITLDLDYAKMSFWTLFKSKFNCAAVLHATHSHSKATPRFRLIVPLDRPVSAEEYTAISRRLAGDINIDLFDHTGFQPHRLMFWPSTSSDVALYHKTQKGEYLSADTVLSRYVDWKDVSSWPICSRETKLTFEGEKQQDPLTKKGIVGTFCRAYSISEAIESLLSDTYEEHGDGRYTYVNGSTVGGLVLYKDKFAYSHHGSDPCSSKTVNAFDLVRLHKFGHLDADLAPQAKRKSFDAMIELATELGPVKQEIAKGNLAKAAEYFDNMEADGSETNEAPEEISIEWMERLEVTSKGEYVASAANLSRIFKHDPKLGGALRLNEFDGMAYLFKSVPWRKVKTFEPMRNVDFAGIRRYIETVYGIANRAKIEDALVLQLESDKFHPIRDYLQGLKWDGGRRVHKVLSKFYGADKNDYTEQVITLFMVAAVARIYKPATKFDYVMTLIGEEGKNKSTLGAKLAGRYFSDSFHTIKGKEAFEQLQGAWLVEMAELAGLRKAEREATKHFISKTEDRYRPAYGRTNEIHPRQCVFFATTNMRDFLEHGGGNRRFWPVEIHPDRVESSIWDATTDYIDQLWAEAVAIYKKGKPLYLKGEVEAVAKVAQRNHTNRDSRAEVVARWASMPVPENWYDMTDNEKVEVVSRWEMGEAVEGYERKRLTGIEVWCDCFGRDQTSYDSAKGREMTSILRSLDGWAEAGFANFGKYGRQRCYEKK